MKTNFRNRVAKALRIRICLFLLALVGTTLAVSRKQVCGQTPFNKVSLKKKELVNPRAASGFSSHAGFLGDAQHRDVDEHQQQHEKRPTQPGKQQLKLTTPALTRYATTQSLEKDAAPAKMGQGANQVGCQRHRDARRV